MRALSLLSLFVWLSMSSHLFSQPLFQVNEKGEITLLFNEGKIDDRFFDGYEYELLAYVGEVFLRENGGQWLVDSYSKDFDPYGILHLDGTTNSGFLSYSFDVIPLYHYGGGLGFTEIYQLMGESD